MKYKFYNGPKDVLIDSYKLRPEIKEPDEYLFPLENE